MSTLQIRSVPESVSRVLKERAARAGMSLSEYALAELTRSARLPQLDEIERQIAVLGPVDTATVPAELVRADREGR